MENFPFVGQSFATYDEFQRHLTNNQKETNYVYTVSRSVSVASLKGALLLLQNCSFQGRVALQASNHWLQAISKSCFRKYGQAIGTEVSQT